ncbi:FliH/SctL family protein [Acidimangrovimonas sediminis]|uniref:FliH/SctL family protein n=1 Tax=Acidimangrovimonas sediminis TaxID=2056283 RepID=UPI000C8070E1|nr:FliH/SctL family protein [Acidimangrovimonas sediminis]
MTSVFHRDFDAEIEAEAREAARVRAAIYTPEDLSAAAEAAAKLAHERGLETGRAEGEAAAMARIEARRADAYEALAPRIDRLLAERLTHRAALEAQLVDFVLSVAEKVLPDFVARRSAEAAADEVRRLMKLTLGSPRLRVRLAPTTRDLMEPELKAMTAERLGTQQVEVVADASLAPGAAHVAWDDGYAEYSYADVCDAILAALKQATADATAPATPEPTDASTRRTR